MNMTLEELLDAFPEHIHAGDETYRLICVKGSKEFDCWTVGYADTYKPLAPLCTAKTLYASLKELWLLLSTHPDFEFIIEAYKKKKNENSH